MFECDNCQYKGRTEEIRKGDKRAIRLCWVCFSTFLGHATEYGRIREIALAKSIAMCTNMILDAIISGRDPREEFEEFFPRGAQGK